MNTSGDTMTGALTIKRVSGAYQNLLTVSGGRIVIQTTAPNNAVDLLDVSGGSLKVSGNINATGTILSVGSIATRGDLTLNIDQSAADTVLTFGSDSTNETLKFLNNEDRFELSDDLRATGKLEASGALIVDGAAILKSTLRLNGVTYTFPTSDGSATGKVLKTSAAGVLSWSTDLNDGGSGLSYADARSHFVDDSGDTMTGALTIKRVSGTYQNLLTVSGGRMVIQTTAPNNSVDLLDVSGGSLKVSGNINATGTILSVGSISTRGDLTLNIDQSAADTVLTFGSDSTNETLKFLNNEDRFEFSDDLNVTGGLYATGALIIGGAGSIKGDFTINSDATAADTVLTFGSDSTNETLKFLNNEDRFEFSDDVRITGGTFASGALIVDGAAILKSTLRLNGVTYTFPTSDGSATGKVLKTSAAGVLSWSTDLNDGGSGLSYADARSYFVDDSGDTMTGALTIKRVSGTYQNLLTVSGGRMVIQTTAPNNSVDLLDVSGGSLKVSGNINATGTILSVGSISTRGDLTLNIDQSAADTVLTFGSDSTNETLKFLNNEDRFEFSDDVRITGGTFASGALIVDGAAILKSTLRLNGVTYTFPTSDGSATGKVLKTSAAGVLSWSTDLNTGGSGLGYTDIVGSFVNTSGDTMTGALTIKRVSGAYQNLLTVSGGRIVIQTTAPNNAVDLLDVSGGSLKVSGNINATGTILSVGSIATRGDLTLNIDQSAADTVLTFGSDSTNETLKFLNNEDRFELSDDLRATGKLEASGALIVDGAAILKSTLRLNGVTYTFPTSDGSATGKVLKTSAAGVLSWSTDLNDGGSGLSYADARSYFVDDSGDTMTGALTIKRVSGTYQNLLTVSGGRMVIQTTAPNNSVDLLDVSGGSLKVSGNINATGTILSVGSISTRGDLTLNIDQSAADTVLTFGSDSTNETLKFLNNEDRFEFSDDLNVTGGLYATGALIIGGAGSIKGDFTINSDATAADTVLTFGSDSTNETLKFLNNEDRFEFSDDVRITGGTFASGALIVDGAAILKSTLRLNGVTYTFPTSDGSATGKVLKTSAAGVLSWSTDLNDGGSGLSYADARSYFVDDSGDTMTGALTIKRVSGTYQNLLTVSGGRMVIQTTAPNNAVDLLDVSGGSLKVSGNINATGTILSVGSISTRGDLTLNIDQSAADTVLTFGSDSTNETLKFLNNEDRFEFSDDLNVTGGLYATGALIIGGAGSIKGDFTINSDATAADTVLTFGSDSTNETLKFLNNEDRFELSDDLRATGKLEASGALIVDGAAILKSTLRLNGVTYTFPTSDGSATGKVLKTSAAGVLSWSTDLNDGGSGLSYADAKSYFVDDSGDTMTGALTIKRVSGTYQNLLTVSGGRMVIQTTAPNNAVDLLDVSGGSLKVSGNINATGTILSVGSISTRGDLTLNIDQSAADTVLTFGSDSTNETLKFLNNEDRFEFSDDLNVTGGLYATGALIIGGAGSIKGDFTINSDATAADTVLTFGSDSTNETLKFLNNEDRFEFSDDVRITGGTFASGALIVDGAAILKSTLRLNGVTYTFPTSDGSATGKVLKTSAAGVLSWSTDLNDGGSGLSYADAKSYFVDDGGDTMTGALTIKRVSGTYQNLLTVSGGRMVIQTTAPNNAVDLLDVSGGSLKVSGNINATGTILSVGSISTRGDLTLNIDQSAADTVLTFGSDSTNETLKFLNNEDRFEFSDDLNVTGGLYATGALIIGGAGSIKGDFTINSDATAADTVLTFGSDSTNETLKFLNNEDRFEFSDDVRITGGTFASGALIVDGAAILKSTLRLNGVTYTFPTSDGTSSGKVLKTNAAGALSWSTDLNTGALSYADAQSYFVDDTGDTMTGALTIKRVSGTYQNLLTVSGGRMVIQTTAPNNSVDLLDVSGGSLKVSGNINATGTILSVGSISTRGDLTLNIDQSAADTVLTFGSDSTNETLKFLNNEDRFEFSDDLNVTGGLYATGALIIGGAGSIKGDFTINSDATAADTVLTFGSDSTNETLKFLNNEDRFEFSDDVHVTGGLYATGALIIGGAGSIKGDFTINSDATAADTVLTFGSDSTNETPEVPEQRRPLRTERRPERHRRPLCIRSSHHRGRRLRQG